MSTTNKRNWLYIARDKNGELYLYNRKPSRQYDNQWAIDDFEDDCDIVPQAMLLSSEAFPKLTWDDEPKRVSLMLRDLKKTPLDLMDEKIRELESLDYDNWDGYNAMPVDKKSIENLKALFRITNYWNFDKWQIAPGVLGDVYLNYKLDYPQAGIIIRPDTYTYFIETDELEGDTKEFNAKKVFDTMYKIEQLTNSRLS